MYIQKKPAATISKAIIGVISLCLTWALFNQFGLNALRIFPTWVVITAAVYFLTSALVTALNPKKFTGRIVCPMLDGLLLVNCLLMSGFAITSAQHNYYLPQLPSVIVWSVCLVLPLLIFLDWLFFAKKGGWKPMYPFYWLGFSISYAAAMIFIAQLLPDGADLRYPLEMFNLIDFGLDSMFGWTLLTAILILAAGYILYLLDFAMSGKLARRIVLPHLQVIEVDEQGNEIKPIEPRATTAEANTSQTQPTTKLKSTTKSKTANAKPSHKVNFPHQKDSPKPHPDSKPKTKSSKTSTLNEESNATSSPVQTTSSDPNESARTSAESKPKPKAKQR